MGAEMNLWMLAWSKRASLDWDAGQKALDDLVLDEGVFNYSREDLQSYFQLIKESINLKSGYATSTTTEAHVLDCGSFWMLITGGMSWGENPTQIGTAIAAFEADYGEVLNAIGFDWSNPMTNWEELLIKVLKVIPTQWPKLLGLDSALDPMLENLLKHKEIL